MIFGVASGSNRNINDIASNSGSSSSSSSSGADKKDSAAGLNFDALSKLCASAVTTNTAVSSVKTSLKYLWTALDSRDSASNPSEGSFLQGSVEVAVPPGELIVIFAKYSI